MKTIPYSEAVNLLESILENPRGFNQPFFIIGETMNLIDGLQKHLVKQPCAKSLNSPTILFIGDFLDQNGNLVSDISSRTQPLADGSKRNALEYVQTVTEKYNQEEYRLLYHKQYVMSPNWSAADRYIAKQLSKPLVILIDPMPIPDEFLDFEFIKCIED